MFSNVVERTWNTWHGPRYMQPRTFNGTQGIKWPNCNPLSPHPLFFLIIYKCTFEHAVYGCFLLSFVSLFRSCDSLGPNCKKNCSAQFTKVFGRIFVGKSEECDVSTSICPQVTPCALHRLQGLKMPGFPVCLFWKGCMNIVYLCLIHIHTHTFTKSLVTITGDMPVDVSAVLMRSCKV